MKNLIIVISIILNFALFVCAEKEISDNNTSFKEVINPKAGDVKTFSGIEFVYIPPGSFIMGSDTYWENEKPPHKVEISKGFWMSKYEITQKQWKSIMGDNPSHFKGDDHPVDSINWYDAQDFIKELNFKGNGKFRLPTEIEWEYACRAGSETEFHFGDDESLVINYAWTTTNGENRSHPVGEKLPNAWGLHDMLGNVWEWCEDWYDENAYKRHIKGDFIPPEKARFRVKRGGSFQSKQKYPIKNYRSAYRGSETPGFFIFNFIFPIFRDQGIRCVRDF